jgi:hypothetical protein
VRRALPRRWSVGAGALVLAVCVGTGMAATRSWCQRARLREGRRGGSRLGRGRYRRHDRGAAERLVRRPRPQNDGLLLWQEPRYDPGGRAAPPSPR